MKAAAMCILGAVLCAVIEAAIDFPLRMFDPRQAEFPLRYDISLRVLLNLLSCLW
jgi:hypothetical protein